MAVLYLFATSFHLSCSYRNLFDAGAAFHGQGFQGFRRSAEAEQGQEASGGELTKTNHFKTHQADLLIIYHLLGYCIFAAVIIIIIFFVCLAAAAIAASFHPPTIPTTTRATCIITCFSQTFIGDIIVGVVVFPIVVVVVAIPFKGLEL